MKKTYTIKSLKWEKNIINDFIESYWCPLPFGQYTIEKFKTNQHWDLECKFDNYELEGTLPRYATTKSEANKIVQDHWESVLKKVLN